MIEKKKFKTVIPWLSIGILLLICLWRFLSPTDSYDAAQYDQLKNTVAGNSSFSDSHALAFLLMHFKHFYWLPELAGLIALIWLAIRKEWLKLAALVISVAAYIYIAAITFHNGDASIMLERIFLPAFFMINLVLADLLFKANRIHKFIPMILVLFFIVNGIHYINWGCLYYKKRVAYLDEIVQKGIAQGNDVYFLSTEDADADNEKILGHWALGAETLIYSKFKYDKCISISSSQNEICTAGSCRITSMLCLPVNELNSNYFHLSGKAYQVLNMK